MIVLIGFMGAGKTTIGRLVAERLGLPFVDSDLVIEQEQRRTISRIFDEEGEPGFRDIEERTVAELLAGSPCVLSLGGGACMRQATRENLQGHTVVYLHVELDAAMARVGRDSYRPLLNNPDLPSLYTARLDVYDSVATVTSYTTGRRVEDIALEIIDRITGADELDGTRGILVAPPGGSYRVHIGQGVLSQVARLLPDLPEAEQLVVISGAEDDLTGDWVAALLGERGLPVHHLRLPAGPVAKSLDGYAMAAQRLAELAVHRGDLLIGVGDEASCDLVGFLAATYNRGMAHALVPTTLEAQADSAIGGKCSVDLPQGANLLGLVHQPVLVICDLERIGDRDYRAGLAEIVKHALVEDPWFLRLLVLRRRQLAERDPATLVQVVRRSVEIKADIVTMDEREQGGRAYLNYGHTFSRAFAAADPSCAEVALPLGLMAAAHLSHRMGRLTFDEVEEHRGTLSALELPTSARFDVDQLTWTLARDKKYRKGWRFVVLDAIGHPAAGVQATRQQLSQALADLADGA